MQRLRGTQLTLLHTAFFLSIAAGPLPAQNAAPALASVTPSTVAAGSSGVVITLNGSNLAGANVLLSNGPTITNSGCTSGCPITYSGGSQMIVSLPDSVVANAGTVKISVVSPANQFSNPVTLTVTGGTGGGGGTLGITTTSLPNGAAGAAYSQQLAASGGTLPYKWSVQNSITGIVDGLQVGTTGLIYGNPTAPGTFNIPIQVTDSGTPPATTNKTLPLIVSQATLAITTTTLPAGITNVFYNQTVQVIGGVTPYTWSVVSGSLPAGLALSATTGAITGGPNAAGASNFTIQVADSSAPPATAKQALSIAVTSLTTVSFAAQTLPGGTVNTPYSQILQGSGGAQPYSFKVAAGALPPGLLLSTSGTLSGIPTLASPFTFTAQLTDASGATLRAPITLTIAAAPLQFTPPILPAGVGGVPYPSIILSGAGGTPPYTFTAGTGNGALPAGLTLVNGLISGTPTVQGTASVSITVTDSAQPPASVTVTVPIVTRPGTTPPAADLILSTGSLSYTLAAGASAPPAPTNLTILSTSIASPVNYSVALSPQVSWLSITGPASGAVTPGSVNLSLTAQALALAAQSAPYLTSIVVTCVAPSPCAGNSYKVAVSLVVSSLAPQLLIPTPLVSLAASNSVTQPTAVFGVQNAGGGTISVNAVTPADPWLTVTGVPTTLTAGPPVFATVTANASGFKPGLYQSSITVYTSAGSAIVPVTLVVSNGKVMTLNPFGQQFQMSAGGAVGNPAGSFEVLVDTTATVNWTAAVTPAVAWLSVSTASGTSTISNPGSVSFTINAAASAALAAGSYYGLINVSSNQEANTPQAFLVVLNVAAAGTPSDPDPEPGGLLFISGTGAVPPQNLTLYTSSVKAVPYQASAIADNGATWLSATPLSGTVSASVPAKQVVTVSTTGLTAGTYHGTLTYEFSPDSVRTVNVTLLIPGSVAIHIGPFDRGARPEATTACTPSTLSLNSSGPAGNFSTPAAWPAQLVIALADNCGNAVSNGNVTVAFNNGDSPIALSTDASQPGTYRGTWTPHGTSSQLTAIATGVAPGLTQAFVTIPGRVVPNLSQAPSLTPGGTLNAFNPNIGGGIAPGTAVEIFGSNFAPPGSIYTPTSLPFQTSAGGTSVLIGGIPAPLYFVGPGQINAQAPFELVPGTPYQVIVSTNGGIATPDTIHATPAAPGMASFQSGAIIAQHLDNTLVLENSPAKPGEILVIYLTGLGNTANDPADGTGAASLPTSTAPDNPITLSINDIPIDPSTLLFVGLTPGSVSLYQIDLTVPPGTPDGDQKLTITQAGTSGNVTILPVHK